MNWINGALDSLGWVVMAVIGFLIGTAIMIMGSLFGGGFWIMLLVMTGGLAVWFLASAALDHLVNGGIGRVARSPGETDETVTEFKSQSNKIENASRITFATGVVAAFFVAQIIDPITLWELF